MAFVLVARDGSASEFAAERDASGLLAWINVAPVACALGAEGKWSHGGVGKILRGQAGAMRLIQTRRSAPTVVQHTDDRGG